MLRLGVGERGVSEIVAVAEHIAGLCAAVESLRLPVDLPDPVEPSGPCAVRLVEPEELEGEAGTAIAEIQAWARDGLGVDHVPLVWRSLAHLPRLMVSTWRKNRLVMSGGRLDEAAKACVAFAVAGFRQSPYMIAYTTARLRQSLGLDDKAMVELAGSIMHYVSFNTISHAMLLEAAATEMRAADFRET